MSQSKSKTALVVGATSPTGQLCIRQLLDESYQVTCTTGRAWTPPEDFTAHPALTIQDLELTHINPVQLQSWMTDFDIAIFIPPITISQNILPYIENSGIKRLVFVSSYNIVNFGDTPYYAPFKQAEETILSYKIPSIIIRSTLVIGHTRNPTIHMILNKIRKKRPFIEVKGKDALRQPIDFRDLSRAILHAAKHQNLKAGIYPVAGQNSLSSKALYTAVSHVVGQEPVFWHFPNSIIALAQKITATLLPHAAITAYLSRAGFDRHLTQPSLPDWTPIYTLDDSIKNIEQEIAANT